MKYLRKDMKKPRTMTEVLAGAYQKYFGFPPGMSDKPWVPNLMCSSCFAILGVIASGREKYFALGSPMLWREPTHHAADCYFCLTAVSGIGRAMEVV